MDTSVVPDQALATQLALRVALQTMKERCISLQERLTKVEEENQELRDRLENVPQSTKSASSTGSVMENIQLRTQIAELDRQKMQLSEHINMVSTENRKLWSRLSQIAKEQGCSESGTTNTELPTNIAKDSHNTLTSSNSRDITSPRGCNTNQNLIRSKTFTQHSPNPNLRHKIIPHERLNDSTQDKSLEEITLDTYHHESGAGEEYAVELATEAELGFAYLNVDESGNGSDTELNIEAKKCIDGFEEMRREASRQRRELNAAFTLVEAKLAKTHCPECEKKAQKPEMADKSLETDDSLSELKLYKGQTGVTNSDMHSVQIPKSNQSDEHSVEQPRLNIIQDKIQADLYDKTCPMCGKMFSSAVQFILFREHVETHFIDDSNDVEASIDRNFEFVSHTVGNF